MSVIYVHSGLAVKREATTLHLLGVVYYHNNQLHEAETTWKECLNLDPKDAQTRSNLVSQRCATFLPVFYVLCPLALLGADVLIFNHSLDQLD